MTKRIIASGIVLAIFVLAVLVVFPIDKGILGQKGIRLGLDLQGGVHIVYQADLSAVPAENQAETLDGVKTVLENRVDPFGVTEPLIQTQGSDRILVELPGKSLTDQEKESLSRVAILEFGELALEGDPDIKWENEYGRWKPATATIDGEVKTLSSQYFKNNTYLARDSLTSNIMLVFEWNEEGSKISQAVTTRLLNQPLGIFEGSEALRGDDGVPIAPTVSEVITTNGRITGLSLNEANRLSQQLNAGRLPVPLEKIYDQTVSPTLGSSFVERSVTAGIIGIAAVMLFMIIYYRIPGFLASLGLVYYGALVLAIFKLMSVTLSLAGIGGFVLSIGMAIDANILIFERMKEEMWVGQSLGGAIEAGFRRAWPAIWDGNITTVLAGLILYWLGSSIVESSPVKGFSVTLIIGVVASMFTAITVTRTMLRPFAGTRLAPRTWLFAPYQRRKNA